MRKCRFCGKDISDGARFNHIAHAISESLGNKHIFALEECDDCNQNFSALEQHLGNFLSLMLYLYEVKGKPSRKNPSGLRKIETPDCLFTTENNIKVVTLKNDDDLETFIENIRSGENINIQSVLKFDKFIPLNVYKTFCKFAINLVANEELKHFSKLISWICGQGDLAFRPTVLYTPFAMENIHPKFVYFTQENNIQSPFCVGLFLISNFLFLVEFPSDYTFNQADNSERLKVLFGLGNTLFPNYSFEEIDLSSQRLETMNVRLNIEIPKTCIEGNDYYIVHSEEAIESLLKGDGTS